MDAVRSQDVPQALLKVLQEEAPIELSASSSEELARDRRNHHVTLSDVVEQLHSRIQPPPDKLHPTLSSWLNNITKLEGLINRLQDLASSAAIEHRPQLLNKVAALRETFKEQEERCIKFLQLSEDYANKYLRDIDAEVRQQRALLDNLEERLEAAKKLHGDAVDLQMLYESGTVACMNDIRATGKAVPRWCRDCNGKLLTPSIFRYLAAASRGRCLIQGGWLRDG
jgi:hypothetical protein